MFSRLSKKADDLSGQFKKEMAELFLMLKDPAVPEDRKAKAKGRLDDIQKCIENDLEDARKGTKQRKPEQKGGLS